MSRCYICDKSSISNPNTKVTYHGKKRWEKSSKNCKNL